MVLLAAAVCTKAGKAIVSRQFVEMTKSRIEGLLAAFPKLMSSGKQHTFVETESVRYVYQPLDKLYMLLITTKASNILEDLETLRLFSRVIPEYCKNMEEAEIFNNAFNLIFAFDEIVALGYRESINLSQIRAFTSMESHEEKVYQAVRQTQEREAKLILKEKAKELQRLKVESSKKGGMKPIFTGGGFGSSSYSPSITNDSVHPEITKPAYSQLSKTVGPSKAMKLGSKDKDVDLFVDQLKSEGVNVTNSSQMVKQTNAPYMQPIHTELVHLRIEERIFVTAGRDGDLQSMEVHGLVTLKVKDEEFGKIMIQMNDYTALEAQFQPHPNIDKDLFKKKFQIAMKNHQKPFPVDTDVGVLKWRFQSAEGHHLPLSINFWASHKSDGGSDVNIEYELQHTDKELNDVLVIIPMNHPSPNFMVSECQGEYNFDKAKRALVWSIPVIDSGAPSGSMEFTCKVDPEQLYPVHVQFVSKQKYINLEILGVLSVVDDSPVKYSMDNILMTDKYELN